MLALRRISLGATVLAEPVLRREELDHVLRARDILDHAREQAATLIAHAEQEALEKVAQAEARFWEDANAFLADFQQERDAWRQQAIESVEGLLNLALSRLLDETGLEERGRALARNLADSQFSESSATLYCHPQMAPAVGQWLSQSRFDGHWSLEPNPDMNPQALRLSHANGAFDVDWDSVRQGLAPLGEEQPAEEA